MSSKLLSVKNRFRADGCVWDVCRHSLNKDFDAMAAMVAEKGDSQTRSAMVAIGSGCGRSHKSSATERRFLV